MFVSKHKIVQLSVKNLIEKIQLALSVPLTETGTEVQSTIEVVIRQSLKDLNFLVSRKKPTIRQLDGHSSLQRVKNYKTNVSFPTQEQTPDWTNLSFRFHVLLLQLAEGLRPVDIFWKGMTEVMFWPAELFNHMGKFWKKKKIMTEFKTTRKNCHTSFKVKETKKNNIVKL